MEINTNEVVYTELDQIPILIPIAGHEAPGIAAFNPRDFVIEEETVSIRDVMKRYGLMFTSAYESENAPTLYDVLLLSRADFSRTPIVGDFCYVLYTHLITEPLEKNESYLCVCEVTEFDETNVYVKIQKFVKITGERGTNFLSAEYKGIDSLSRNTFSVVSYAESGDYIVVSKSTQTSGQYQVGSVYRLITNLGADPDSQSNMLWLATYEGNIRGATGLPYLGIRGTLSSTADYKLGQKLQLSDSLFNREPQPSDVVLTPLVVTSDTPSEQKSYIAVLEYSKIAGVAGGTTYYEFIIVNLVDTKGIKGDQGKAIVIVSGIYYDTNNPPPGGPKPGQIPLPAFDNTEEGQAYVVDDAEKAGQYDLYMHNVGGTSWDIVNNWGGIPGPQGEKGLTALEYTGPQIGLSGNTADGVDVDSDKFNRTPVVGDTFLSSAIVTSDEMNVTAIIGLKVVTINDNTVHCELTQALGTMGKGISNVESYKHVVQGDETITYANVYYTDDTTKQDGLEFHAQNGKDGERGYSTYTYPAITDTYEDDKIINLTVSLIFPSHDKFFQYESVITDNGYYLLINENFTPTGTAGETISCVMIKNLNAQGGGKPVIITGPDTIENGTLTTEQYNLLTSNDNNYIILNNEVFLLMDKQHDPGYLIYSHVGHNSVNNFMVKCITITTNTKAWSLATQKIGEGEKGLDALSTIQAISVTSTPTVNNTVSVPVSYFNRTPKVNENCSAYVNATVSSGTVSYLVFLQVTQVLSNVTCKYTSVIKLTGADGENSLQSFECGTSVTGTSGSTPVTYVVSTNNKQITFYIPIPAVGEAKEVCIGLYSASTAKASAIVNIFYKRESTGSSVTPYKDTYSYIGTLEVLGPSYMEKININFVTNNTYNFYGIDSISDFSSGITVRYAVKTYKI